VLGVALGLGVAREIQPYAAPTLAVRRRLEQPVDELVVGGGILVVGEGIRLLDRGRKARQVERESAHQRIAVGFGRGFEPFLDQPDEDEAVNLVPDPACGALDVGYRGPLRLYESPVLGVGRALLDPPLEELR